MDAKECFQNGQLHQAILLMSEEVKKEPQNLNKRDFLTELLCIAGEFDRADKQLTLLAEQAPNAAMGAALFRQLIRAEQMRQQCFSEGRVPEFIGKVSAAQELTLRALIELREGSTKQARIFLRQAEASRILVQGTCNEVAFRGIRDCDDACASFFEVLTSNGKYYWVPIERIAAIEFHPPERPIDLIWRRVHMSVQNGPEGEVYIPATYVHTPSTDEAAKLGYKTDWQAQAQLLQGVGQRLYLIGEKELPVMELKNLVIEQAPQ